MIALNDITNHQISLELNYEIRIEEVLDIFSDAGNLQEKLGLTKDTHYLEAQDLFAEYCEVIMNLRFAIYDQMANSWSFADKIHQECSKSFPLWCNLFGITYNPIYDNKPITPFLLFPYQKEFFEATQKYNRIMVIKPRGVGFTWVKAHINTWRLIYKSFKGVVVSRVEEDLDLPNDRHQTIFGRMMFILESLPYTVQYTKSHRIINVKSNSKDNQYLGKTSNPHAGRSTRADLVEIEEAGVIANFIDIMRAMNSVSKRVIIGGSVSSDSNGFYDYWIKKDSAYHHILWEYWMNPIFACKGWIEKTREEYASDEDGFKQEILVDFFATLQGTIFKFLNKGIQIKQLPVITNRKKLTAIDPGFGSSPTAIWFYEYDADNKKFYYTGYWEQKNTTIDEITSEITRRGYKDATHFIDEHANKRDVEGKTLESRMRNAGLAMVTVNNKDITTSCKYSNDLLYKGQIFFLECEEIEEAKKKLSRYRYAKTGDKQVKDENSDCGDAFRYSHACISYFDNISNLMGVKRFKKNTGTTYSNVTVGR